MRIETKINDEECRIDVDGKTIVNIEYMGPSIYDEEGNLVNNDELVSMLTSLKKLNKLIKILAPDAEIIER